MAASLSLGRGSGQCLTAKPRACDKLCSAWQTSASHVGGNGSPSMQATASAISLSTHTVAASCCSSWNSRADPLLLRRTPGPAGCLQRGWCYHYRYHVGGAACQHMCLASGARPHTGKWKPASKISACALSWQHHPLACAVCRLAHWTLYRRIENTPPSKATGRSSWALVVRDCV
jgi:hypothetical protein